MSSIRNSPYFNEAFQELNYPFGDFFLFETFVIAEIKKDIVFNWEDHAKGLVEELSNLYEQRGKDIVYISNRVNEYSVVPSDWLYFFKFSYSLKGYGVVSYNPKGRLNTALERLFMRSKMKSFTNLESAIYWAKKLTATNASELAFAEKAL